MILSLPKSVFLAVCIYVAAAIDFPCDQVKNNPAACTFDRFKTKCAKECGGNTNTQNNANNGNNGGGGGGGPVTTKPVTVHHGGSSEERSITKSNQEGKIFGKGKKTPKPKSGEVGATVTVHQDIHQDSTIKVTDRPFSTGAGHSYSHGDHHDSTKIFTGGPFTGVTNSVNGVHSNNGGHHNNEEHRSTEGHHSNENHNGDSGSKEHSHNPSSHSTGHHSTATTKNPSAGVARSQSNKNCNKVDPCVDKAVADEGFKKRCQAAGIKDTCWDKCRYDITFDELKKAMLSKLCPMDGMRAYLQCGANSQDNRSCCTQTGVLEGKRAFCHPFCNPTGAEWPAPNQAMKYLPCASQMNAIMRCHWAGLTE